MIPTLFQIAPVDRAEKISTGRNSVGIIQKRTIPVFWNSLEQLSSARHV
jgi:hypothetical protein